MVGAGREDELTTWSSGRQGALAGYAPPCCARQDVEVSEGPGNSLLPHMSAVFVTLVVPAFILRIVAQGMLLTSARLVV